MIWWPFLSVTSSRRSEPGKQYGHADQRKSWRDDTLMSDRTGSVQLIVILRANIARHFNSTGAWHGIANEISDVAKDFGVSTEPLHPGTPDATLSRYFVVDRIDPSAAQRMATRLKNSPAVEVVYVKAPGEAP